MTGELPSNGDGLDNETLHEALDLCLQCKACKSECPSKVDMAKLKAEVLHQHYQSRPRPLEPPAHGPDLPAQPDRVRPRLRWPTRRCDNPAFKWLLEKTAGIDRRRTLPTFVRNHFRKWFTRHAADPRSGRRGSVVLLDDCFTTYNDPEVGIAAVRVLEAAGYRVELAGLALLRPAGDLQGTLAARPRAGRANVEKLLPLARQGIPIVGCEPSCLVTLVDEYRDFRLGPDADDVARPRSWSTPSSPIRHAVPDLPLRPLHGPRPAARPLPAEGRGRHGGHAGRPAA